ncbi:MAG: flagellar basal body P-ring formation chaperone FlgA [Pseudomonadota bacterium]
MKNRQKQRGKYGVLLLMMVTNVGLLTVEASAQWQTVESIRTAALTIAKKEIRLPNSSMDFHVGALDPRHRLPQCDKPLKGFLLERTRITAHTTVGVRCDGQKSWQVYVPIQINVYKSVLVTVRPVPRGQALTGDDVRMERRNVAGRQYVTDMASVTHQQVRRDLAPGTLITSNMLRARHIVKRGQTVTIFNKNNGLHIRMAGVALQDGYLNQRIRIRNRNSNKELEGIVRSPQSVEIML